MGHHKAVRLLSPVEHPQAPEEIESIFGPYGGRYTEVGLIMSDGLPEDACWNGLSTLNKIRNSVEFAIGDVLNYIGPRYGNTYDRAMEITELSYSTLSGYCTVAAAFPIDVRRPGVAFSHHADTMVLMDGYPDIAFEILDRAREERLTSREVRFDVKQAKHDLGLDKSDPIEPIPITRHEFTVRAITHTVQEFERETEIAASVEWLDDLLDIVVALTSAEPAAYEIVRARAVDWCIEHGIPLQLPEPAL